jgi:hypothetical protein
MGMDSSGGDHDSSIPYARAVVDVAIRILTWAVNACAAGMLYRRRGVNFELLTHLCACAFGKWLRGPGSSYLKIGSYDLQSHALRPFRGSRANNYAPEVLCFPAVAEDSVFASSQPRPVFVRPRRRIFGERKRANNTAQATVL